MAISVFGECFLPRSRPGACKDAGNDNVDIRGVGADPEYAVSTHDLDTTYDQPISADGLIGAGSSHVRKEPDTVERGKSLRPLIS